LQGALEAIALLLGAQAAREAAEATDRGREPATPDLSAEFRP
jgi:hypothetical protein